MGAATAAAGQALTLLAHVQGPDPNSRRIAEREDEYKRRRLAQMISPARNDAFLMGDKTPDARTSTYADRLKASQLAQERENTLRNIADKRKAEAEAAEAQVGAADRERPTKASLGKQPAAAAPSAAEAKASKKRGNRWDAGGGTADACAPQAACAGLGDLAAVTCAALPARRAQLVGKDS